MGEIGPRWTNMLPAIIKYSMRRQERKTEIDRRGDGHTLTVITPVHLSHPLLECYSITMTTVQVNIGIRVQIIDLLY